MASTVRQARLFGALIAAPTAHRPITTLPAFLVPSLARPQPSQRHPDASQRRCFSFSDPRASKLGRVPLSIPPGVELALGEPYVKHDPTTYLQIPKRKLNIKGPLGSLDLNIPPYMRVEQDPKAQTVTLSIQDKAVTQQRQMWGTVWSYLKGYMMGVSEGHTAILRMVGVGYRATVEDRPELAEYPGQKFVCLKLGYSHPIEMGTPPGVTAATPQPTIIMLQGIDKEVVMQFAANIRRWRKPEPYKGKGIFVNGETIKLKQKKIS